MAQAAEAMAAMVHLPALVAAPLPTMGTMQLVTIVLLMAPSAACLIPVAQHLVELRHQACLIPGVQHL